MALIMGLPGAVRRTERSRKAIFIDKDGTLVENIPYNVDCSKIRLVPEAEFALPLFNRLGYDIIIVSNQAGVARGMFEESQLEAVRDRLFELVAGLGVSLTEFIYCPHDAEAPPGPYSVECSCRKPAPGMLLKAAEKYGIDLENSWMLGDILDDIQAGKAAGCRTIMVDQGNETLWEISPLRVPDYTVRDLVEAACIIELKSDRGRKLAA
jgi:D-glycero-D-manno-heptose 1,7-bisphosphate phosphatase